MLPKHILANHTVFGCGSQLNILFWDKTVFGFGTVTKIFSTGTTVNWDVNRGKYKSCIVVSMIEMEGTRMNESHF